MSESTGKVELMRVPRSHYEALAAVAREFVKLVVRDFGDPVGADEVRRAVDRVLRKCQEGQ